MDNLQNQGTWRLSSVHDKKADLRLLVLIRRRAQITPATWGSLIDGSTHFHGAMEDIVKATHDLGQGSQEIVGSVRVGGSAFGLTTPAGGWSFQVSYKAAVCRVSECAHTDSYPTVGADGASAPSWVPAVFI